MSHIIHAVINVTEQVQAEAQLRESQTREQAANAAAEAQRQQLYQTFQEAPAMICVFDGPRHVFQFVNPPYQALVGTRPLVGKPIAEAMPELAGQPIFELLDGVCRTGETFRANEMLVQLDHDNLGSQALEKRYYNFIYQARHNLSGAVNGIFVFAYDVTTQALARQQVQELNEELAAINEELHASNEEFLNANAELTHAQLQFQQLNQELETRVAARTQDARGAGRHGAPAAPARRLVYARASGHLHPERARASVRAGEPRLPAAVSGPAAAGPTPAPGSA